MQPTSNAPMGPGSIAAQGESPPEILEKVGDNQYVTVLNTLPVDFHGMVGVDRPVNEPFVPRQTPNVDLLTRTESDVSRNYGLNLKNKDHPSKRHITHTIVLPAGGSVNLLGGQAKTVVRQLVTAILQFQDRKLLIADRHARHEIEQQVIQSISSVSDILGGAPQTPQQQAMSAIDKLNEVQHHESEPEFPEIAARDGDRQTGAGTVESQIPIPVPNPGGRGTKVELAQAKDKVALETARLHRESLLSLSEVTERVKAKQSFYERLEANHQKKVDKLHDEQKAEREKLTLMDKRASELIAMQSDARSSYEALKSKFDSLKASEKTAQERVIQLSADRGELEAKLVDLKADIDDQKLTTDINASVISDQQAHANSLADAIEAARAELAHLTHEKTQVANDTAKLRADIDSLHQDIAKRALELDRRDEALVVREQRVNSLEKRVAEYNRFMKLT